MSMIRKYHNYKLQTTQWHREEEPLNHHETPGRQIKQSNQLSLPLISKGRRKAQSEDHDISFIVDLLLDGHKPSSSEADAYRLDKRMIVHWTKYHLKDGVLYKTNTLSDEEFYLFIYIFINNVFRGKTHLAYRLFYHVALHKRHELYTYIQTSNK